MILFLVLFIYKQITRLKNKTVLSKLIFEFISTLKKKIFNFL